MSKHHDNAPMPLADPPAVVDQDLEPLLAAPFAQAWEQAPEPATPERRQVDPTGCTMFPDEQRGDQEARECEEQIDAEEPARDPPEVIRHHADDGEAAQAVEFRPVRCPGGGARSGPGRGRTGRPGIGIDAVGSLVSTLVGACANRTATRAGHQVPRAFEVQQIA